MFDVVIIGLGPAGSTLARLLAGRKVLCLDKKASRPGGFKKPCGGLLAPDAQKALARFDLTLPKSVLVDPQLFSVRTLDLSTGLCRHYQRFYVNMDRDKFDRWLMSLIPSSAEVKEAAWVTDITRDADGAFTVTFVQTGKPKRARQTRGGAEARTRSCAGRFFPRIKSARTWPCNNGFKKRTRARFIPVFLTLPKRTATRGPSLRDVILSLAGLTRRRTAARGLSGRNRRLKNTGFNLARLLKPRPAASCGRRGGMSFAWGKGRIFNRLGRRPYQPSSMEGFSSALISARRLAQSLAQNRGRKNTAAMRGVHSACV
jgi:hypothetical protein